MTEPAGDGAALEEPMLLIGRIVIEEFLDETGERQYTVDGTDMPLSTSLGMLRLAEHWLVAETYVADPETYDDEDDDDD